MAGVFAVLTIAVVAGFVVALRVADGRVTEVK